MSLSPRIATLLVLALGLIGATAPGASAAEGVGRAKSLGGAGKTAPAADGARVNPRGVATKLPVVAPAPKPTPEAAPVPGPGSGAPVYWGATIGPHLTGTQAPWDMSAVTKFEESARKKASMLQFFQPFANCNPNCSFYQFPTSPLESIRSHGSIPVLSWSSQSIPSTKVEPDFQLSDVISGRYDTYIREFATAAKAWGHPFFLRFNWEMNGNWFPWHEGVNGNKAGESATAWRHVHDIFTSVGATNATWTWCPNVEYSGSTSLASLYPGDSYVDWTCLDGYNSGTNPAKPDSWKTFGQVYKASYQKIVETIAPSKPMMIGEVASTEHGGSKASWIKDMLVRIPTEYTKIRAVLWFDKFDSNMDWPRRDLQQRHQRLRRRPAEPGLPGQLLRQPQRDGDSAAQLSAGFQPPGHMSGAGGEL